MWRKNKFGLRYFSLGLGLLILLLGASSLSAQGVSSIAQGFQTTDSNVVAGALVSLKNSTPSTIELSNSGNADRLVGVVGNKSLIELSSGTAGVQVITSGTAPTLVSDINGIVKVGDKITASPIAGVGMRATSNTLIVGTALGNLSVTNAEKRTVTDKSGKQKQINVSAIPVQVDKVFYEVPEVVSSFLPPALQDLANNVAGKKVSPVRVAASVLLVLFLLVAITILLYSAVRSSIISIGRNPLSEHAVRKSLIQVGLAVVGLALLIVVVIYLILTL
ncbi:MAG TPA: hypothetical protein VMR45_00735 [Patescibacteria group bacterium]|nr:hypothetical protein [Patescibacteria group bacterium]